MCQNNSFDDLEIINKADEHQQVWLGDGVKENRRKSVGERIKEIECLKFAPTVKANGVADRLPSLKKCNGVADMLPAWKR